jgi:hypothetical protein
MIARVILGEQRFVSPEAPRDCWTEMFPVRNIVREFSQFQMPQLGVCETSDAEGTASDGNNQKA